MSPRFGSEDAAATDDQQVLRVSNLEVVYDDTIVALRGVSLSVPRGSIVTVLGANGAGKTTLLRAITGTLDAHDGEVTRGDLFLNGTPITHADSADIVRQGVGLVPEGRRIFSTLSVADNLKAGGLTVPDRRRRSENMERMLDLFPVLRDRVNATAGYLSGGEQQMLAVSRALMSEPRILLLDEPSLGLAPLIVQQIRDVVREVNRSGTTVLLIEQNAHIALEIADYGYVLENGKVVMDGPAEELRESSDIKEFYLGFSGEGARRSFRKVKTYRRKKRWVS